MECAARRKLYNVASGTTSPEIPYENKRAIKRQRMDDKREEEIAQSVILTKTSLRDLLEDYRNHSDDGGRHRLAKCFNQLLALLGGFQAIIKCLY